MAAFYSLSGVYAQYYSPQNRVWTFGTNTGLNFATGTPVAVASGLSTAEGCATLCDTVGHLMFYTDGKTVYNSTNAVMSAGTSIVPFATASTSQAAVIAPVISNTHQYYIFSLEQAGGTGVLYYCKVDMSLASGLGAVVASSSTHLDTLMSEKMIAVPGYSCNIWLITHRRDSAKFRVYEITSAGISATPVVSSVGFFTGMNAYATGVIKASSDGHKLALQNAFSGVTDGTEIFDFDPATGIVSNGRVIDSSHENYGAEFSPDGTKLYVNEIIGSSNHIAQFDVSLPTVSAIMASKITVVGNTGGFNTDLKLGPDGKLYFNSLSALYYVGRIDSPDLAGMACAPEANAVYLSPGSCQLGLPNSYAAPGTTPIIGTSPLCAGTSSTWTNATSGGQWSSSNPAVATVGTSGLVTGVSNGTAIITYLLSETCGIVRATKLATVIGIPHASLIVGVDTVCPGHTTKFKDSVSGGVWKSLDTVIAKVNDTGLVSGLTPGLDTILYIITNPCGSDTVRHTVYVRSFSTICPTEVFNIGDPLKEVNVFPNPNRGSFVVNVLEPAQVVIINLLGARVMELSVPANTPTQVSIDAPPGFYFLSAITTSGSWNEKIQVVR